MGIVWNPFFEVRVGQAQLLTDTGYGMLPAKPGSCLPQMLRNRFTSVGSTGSPGFETFLDRLQGEGFV